MIITTIIIVTADGDILIIHHTIIILGAILITVITDHGTDLIILGIVLTAGAWVGAHHTIPATVTVIMTDTTGVITEIIGAITATTVTEGIPTEIEQAGITAGELQEEQQEVRHTQEIPGEVIHIIQELIPTEEM